MYIDACLLGIVVYSIMDEALCLCLNPLCLLLDLEIGSQPQVKRTTLMSFVVMSSKCCVFVGDKDSTFIRYIFVIIVNGKLKI